MVVTLTAALGLGRLFSSGSWAGPLLVTVVAAHALAVGGRRWGLGGAGGALVSVVGLAALVTWVVEPHTTAYGLPTSATWRSLVADVAEAWRQFAVVKAPTEAGRPFVLTSVTTAWLIATLADAFAYRLLARFESLAPSFTLLVFGAILAPSGPAGRGPRLAVGAGYLAAVVLFLVLTEAARSGPWAGSGGGAGAGALVRRGTAMGAVAVAVAVIAGPLLPWAESLGLVGLGVGGDAPSSRSRNTVSPLVDIRGRLVEQSDLEMFTVVADQRAYWRLTALDRFDGTIWSSLGTYRAATGRLPDGPATTRAETAVSQQFAIGPLSSIWLPAAFRAESIDGADGARFDRDSASLLTARPTADGLSYAVVSAVPTFTAEDLDRATAAVPPEIAQRYLKLPEAFPARITTTARDVVVRAVGPGASPYATARALQDWFRSTFAYDLTVEAGHSLGALEHFLATRRGYCEQFAGAFAAMARSLGLPARVAVGFTPGSPGPDGRFHVAGRDAHAWPEVYIAGFGWVAFEPTPGRDVPGGAGYTGVQPPPPGGQDGAAPTTTVAGAGSAVGEPEPEPEPAPTAVPPGRPGPVGATARALGLILLANGAYLAVVVGGRRWLRGRRRAAAATPSARVLVAWAEAEEALAAAGMPRLAAETATEFASRVAASRVAAVRGWSEIAGRLVELAQASGLARFAPGGAPAGTAAAACQAAAELEARLRAGAGWFGRLRWAADPRPLGRAVKGWATTRWAATPT